MENFLIHADILLYFLYFNSIGDINLSLWFYYVLNLLY